MKFYFSIILFVISVHAGCHSQNSHGLYSPYDPFEKPVFINEIYKPVLILPSLFQKYNVSCQLFDRNNLVMQYTPDYFYCNSKYGQYWSKACNLSSSVSYIYPSLSCTSQTNWHDIFLVLINNTGIMTIYTTPTCS